MNNQALATNFAQALNSRNLWFNFDTNELITDVELRERTTNGYSLDSVSADPEKFPVFGNVQRAMNFWMPRIENHYRRVIDNLPPNLDMLPRDVLSQIIKSGNLSGQEVLAMCQVSSTIANYCRDNQKSIFSDLIRKEYPNFDTSEIPDGHERETYIDFLNSGTIMIHYRGNEFVPVVDLPPAKKILFRNQRRMILDYARKIRVYSENLREEKIFELPTQSKVKKIDLGHDLQVGCICQRRTFLVTKVL